MTIFRWIIGSLAALFAAGSLLSFAMFMAIDNPVLLERTRKFRRATFTLLLLWFNVEIWGRVVYTLVTW